MRVGFIGLGAMGAPMAGHLARAGLLAAVSNRSMDKAVKLAAELGVQALTPEAMAAHCDAIVLCVSADEDVLDLARRIGAHMPAGGLVIDHSTISPVSAREAAQILGQQRVECLDAPVSGGVEGARNGKLSIMVGGTPDAHARAHPILGAYGARITLMGDSGAGQATKAVNQVLVAGIAQAVCEGLALSERLGLDAERLLPVLASGAAQSWFLERRGATMLRDEYSVGFKLSLLHKDLGILQSLAAALGAKSLPVVDASREAYAELMRRGLGDCDISALIELKRDLFGD